MHRGNRTRRATALAALVAAGALLAAGCSSDGGKKAQERTDSEAGGKVADTPRMEVAMVTHAAPGDTFWDMVRSGGEAAARKDNIKLVYSSSPNANDQANLVQNAVDQKVDAIVVTASKPDAMKPVVAKAREAGIPVIGVNAGLDQWQELGMLEFFGQDETIAGEKFGEKLNEVGAKHAVCVIHEQGSVALEARCAGLKKTFRGETENLYVNGADMPSVKSTVNAKLKQASGIDYVVTLGAPFALASVDAVDDAGSDAKVATFDTNKQLVGAIESGEVQFAVDQQPWLQGYLAVDAAWLFETNGNYSGGGAQPVLTGPAFITKDNIGEIAEFAEKGTR
ncbi:sugar ABC transporter substrate-binding protein [Streptomyces capparidis]